MTVTTSIPDGLSLQAGEEIQFQALVQTDGTFLVTRVMQRKDPDERSLQRMSLSEWSRKWAGKFPLPEGQTVEDLRREAVRKKQGI